MVFSKNDMSKWKSEQVNYFKQYLDSFDQGSKQYDVLKRGISELEKTDL